MRHKQTASQLAQDTANTDAAPCPPNAVQDGMAGDTVIQTIFIVQTPDTALERRSAADLWRKTAFPANDNLRLTAD